MPGCKHLRTTMKVTEEPGEPTIGPYVVHREYCIDCGREVSYGNPPVTEHEDGCSAETETSHGEFCAVALICAVILVIIYFM